MSGIIDLGAVVVRALTGAFDGMKGVLLNSIMGPVVGLYVLVRVVEWSWSFFLQGFCEDYRKYSNMIGNDERWTSIQASMIDKDSGGSMSLPSPYRR